MTATNHAVTGAVIGLLPVQPVLAVALAFLSHFICDALPHFGITDGTTKFLRSQRFLNMLVADMVLCVALVVVLASAQPQHWLLASVCAFVATVPDMAWLPGYIRARRGKQFRQRPNAFMRFAANIQWFEKPIGLAVEIAWFVTGSLILSVYL